VGHPVVDRLSGFEPDPSLFESVPDGSRLVGLLPGSRRREVRANLPMMARAASLLREREPRVAFAAAFPDQRLRDLGAALLDEHLPGTLVLTGRAQDLMARAAFCFVCAGSATLELAFFGTPMAVVYRIKPQAWLLAKALMSARHMALPNIIAGRRVVPEFLTVRDRARELADTARTLLNDTPERETCVAALGDVRSQLGGPGAAERAARIAVEMAERERGRRQG